MNPINFPLQPGMQGLAIAGPADHFGKPTAPSVYLATHHRPLQV